MKLQFYKVSKHFVRLAWRWNMDYHHFHKRTLFLPCSSNSSHFSCSLETGCPSLSSTYYLKARDLPPSALSLLQLVTFARPLQIPNF